MSERFDIIKPVEGHPEELCCTECWQRGISWGSAGREEEIIKLLYEHGHYCEQPLSALIALIRGENK